MRQYKGKRTIRIALIAAALVLVGLILAGLLAAKADARAAGIAQGHTQAEAVEENPFRVTFLNVGQGNCMIAESDGHYMMIDGGDNKHSSFVVSYCQNLGIEQFDYIVVSHYDADHLSGLVGVLLNFRVGTVLAPGYEADTKIYQSYLTALKTRQLTATVPAIGDTYMLGSASFTVVAPVSYAYDEENNNSIGIRMTDGYHSFLVLGDAQTKSEKDILETGENLKSDVYVVSHHGSSSSTSAALLQAVQPSYGVISVGDNDYGHPTDKILDRLARYNVSVLRTDQDGTLIAYSTQNGLEWQKNVPTKLSKSYNDSSEALQWRIAVLHCCKILWIMHHFQIHGCG